MSHNKMYYKNLLAITIFYSSILLCGIHGRNFNGNFTLVNSRIKRQDCNGFKCNSGECIENDLFCDGIENCKDGSDEISSECKKLSCPGYLFRCKYGACIDSNKVCNGQKDCKDFSDEQNCPNNNSCRNGQFRCSNGDCIPQDEICDGTSDCTDGSDETTELCSTKSCPGYLYRCKYGACVDGFARCDGKKDCNDNSDEESCPSKKPTSTTPPPPPPAPVKPVTGGPGNGCQLPPFPSNGKWEVQQPGKQGFRPGDYVTEWTTVLFSCNKGYVLRDKQSRAQVCSPGLWLSIKPECLKLCPPVPDTPTTTMSCKLDGNPVNCLEPPEGTRLTYTCKQFYVDQDSSLTTLRRCADGTWNEEAPKCVQGQNNNTNINIYFIFNIGNQKSSSAATVQDPISDNSITPEALPLNLPVDAIRFLDINPLRANRNRQTTSDFVNNNALKRDTNNLNSQRVVNSSIIFLDSFP